MGFFNHERYHERCHQTHSLPRECPLVQKLRLPPVGGRTEIRQNCEAATVIPWSKCGVQRGARSGAHVPLERDRWQPHGEN